VLLCEINLRLGGTTHPFGMTLLATGATYAQASGELVAEGVAKSYVATDNLEPGGLIGRSPGDVIAMVERRGLGFDTRTRTGTTLHTLGAVQRFGKRASRASGTPPSRPRRRVNRRCSSASIPSRAAFSAV
jgi:hypothetical protein